MITPKQIRRFIGDDNLKTLPQRLEHTYDVWLWTPAELESITTWMNGLGYAPIARMQTPDGTVKMIWRRNPSAAKPVTLFDVFQDAADFARKNGNEALAARIEKELWG